MRASSLTARVTITQRTHTTDPLGQPLDTWTTLMTVWGDPRYKTGLESLSADRINGGARVSIRIRQTSCSRGIARGMRAQIAGDATVYEIKDLPLQGREAIDLVCEGIQ